MAVDATRSSRVGKAGSSTVDESESTRFFRGNELPRLLGLLSIALLGWVLVWHYLFRTSPKIEEPELVVAGKPAEIVPDSSPEFESVKDKTSIGFRDMAAYDKLLTRARDATADSLAADARRDVFYQNLWQSPKEYRGVPVHILGVARKVLYYKSNLSRTGWLYEAWIITPDLPLNPYVCVFEEAPKGFPVGQNTSERVVFNGYFLKLLAYEAADRERGAALLIGRVGWNPRTAGKAKPGASGNSVYYLAGAVLVMFVISLTRWILMLRRSLRPRPINRALFNHSTEEIAPEELSSFLATLPEDDETPKGL
jgi:hypothetical protein